MPISTLPFETVRDYDQRFFPADRSTFLGCWVGQPGSTAVGWLEGVKLKGYGMVRPCRAGYKVGPLFAERPAIAQQRFAALKSSARSDVKIYLDTPQVNPSAIDLARRHAMGVMFETARMYTGRAPRLPIDRLYGVPSFELG